MEKRHTRVFRGQRSAVLASAGWRASSATSCASALQHTQYRHRTASVSSPQTANTDVRIQIRSRLTHNDAPLLGAGCFPFTHTVYCLQLRAALNGSICVARNLASRVWPRCTHSQHFIAARRLAMRDRPALWRCTTTRPRAAATPTRWLRSRGVTAHSGRNCHVDWLTAFRQRFRRDFAQMKARMLACDCVRCRTVGISLRTAGHTLSHARTRAKKCDFDRWSVSRPGINMQRSAHNLKAGVSISLSAHRLFAVKFPKKRDLAK